MILAEQRLIETRLGAELFGYRYWATSKWREATRSKLIATAYASYDKPSVLVEITPAEAATCGDIWNHNAYCSDWSLLPSLLAECVNRNWNFKAECVASRCEPWVVLLWHSGITARGYGDSLPLALCRAIVAVLDATTDTGEASDEGN